MTRSRAGLYGLIGFMTFIWGVNYVAAKLSLRSFPPLLFAPLRTLLAAVFLFPIYGWMRKRRPHGAPWTRKEVWTLIVLGVCGITLNQTAFIIGMNNTSVAHAALLIAMGPVFVMLLAAMRGQETITARKAAGMGLAICGVAALQVVPGRAEGSSALGDLFILIGAFFFSLFTVFGKEVTSRHDAVTVNTVGYAAGALAGLPLMFWAGHGFDFASVSAAGWTMMVYMALFPSVLCYLIFYYALTRIDASRVAAFSYAQPVIASLTGLAVLGEPVTLPVALGGMLVLSGVWLTGRR
ncbi:MAG TPA: DMT family transporter [Bryobacteraceae bacterium]|nr:DMT family transporter [Bryobacteraceae bacterium]